MRLLLNIPMAIITLIVCTHNQQGEIMNMSEHKPGEWEIRRIEYLKSRHAAQKPLDHIQFPPLSAEEKKQRDDDVKAGRLPF